MRKPVIVLTALASLIAAPAFAATTTGVLTVRATVEESCVLDTTNAQAGNALLDFGTVTSLVSNVDADTTTGTNASLALICSNGTTYTVALDAGANASGQQRRMAGGASEFLPYDLYSDSARAAPISSGASFASASGNGRTQTIPIYGRIPAGSTLPGAGAYVDTVTLTVTY